jgi:hypothetical protein
MAQKGLGDVVEFPIALGGGLDLVTRSILLKPGRMIAGSNYEAGPRGYQRCDGFERYDGRIQPSDASYSVIAFDAGVATITLGQTVTGATSGATAIMLANMIVDSGTFGGSNAAGRLVVSEVTGTFIDNENLRVAGVTKCVANGTAVDHGAANDTDDATWEALAIERRRALIQVVPGSGPVRGVWVYADAVWAIRDNIGATAAVLHKATAAGWVAQDLGREVAFTSGGAYVVAEGNTITGATSAATAIVKRVILTSGTWAGGDAAGRLILLTQTGNFVAENLNVGANVNVATIAGNTTAHALLPGGRFDFCNHNFRGAASSVRMYAADGVNRAFEWDGTTFVPLVTGMTDDTPDFVTAHQQHLMLGFKEGSLQTSNVLEPYLYTALGGASEIAVGFEITGLLSDVAGVLVIFCKTAVSILYGTGSTTWDLRSLSEDAASLAWTMQMIGSAMYMDDQGIRSLATTQNFGDFRIGTVTRAIQPLFLTKKAAGATPVASMRVRAKDQYRLFFSDNTGVAIYFGNDPTKPEITTFDLALLVACACSGRMVDSEVLFIGTSTGYVMRVDKGTSYDGAAVDAFARLPFTACGMLNTEKRFFKATLEADAAANASIQMAADFDYASESEVPAGSQSFTVAGGGGFWAEANWAEFYWSAPNVGVAECYFEGLGVNISLLIKSNSTYEDPHTLQAVRLHLKPQRFKR